MSSWETAVAAAAIEKFQVAALSEGEETPQRQMKRWKLKCLDDVAAAKKVESVADAGVAQQCRWCAGVP